MESKEKIIEKKDKNLDQLGRLMIKILRHTGIQSGFQMNKKGQIKVQDLINSQQLQKFNPNIDKIKIIVKNCEKQRFELEWSEQNKEYLIRASQGHSIKQIDDEQSMKRVNSLDQLNQIIQDNNKKIGKQGTEYIFEGIHGTYFNCIEIIIKQGLNKMKRNHVHMSIGIGEGVTSGMRRDCEVYIYLDLQLMLDQNVPIYISTNNVLLSSGIDGIIPPSFFTRVLNKAGKIIYPIH